MNRKYGCVILAGGSGKRMGGRNKAELEYKRQTFAERIEDELRTLGMSCYVSSAAYDQRLPEGWKLVRDCVTGAESSCIGPMAGVYSCLRQAEEDGLDGLFFVPCDAPLFSGEIIRGLEKLLENASAGSHEPDILVWRTGDGRVQTAYGWYSLRCLPVLEEDIRNGKYKLRAAMDKLNCMIIDTADADIRDDWFTNINSEEDYRQLCSELAHYVPIENR